MSRFILLTLRHLLLSGPPASHIHLLSRVAIHLLPHVTAESGSRTPPSVMWRAFLSSESRTAFLLRARRLTIRLHPSRAVHFRVLFLRGRQSLRNTHTIGLLFPRLRGNWIAGQVFQPRRSSQPLYHHELSRPKIVYARRPGVAPHFLRSRSLTRNISIRQPNTRNPLVLSYHHQKRVSSP